MDYKELKKSQVWWLLILIIKDLHTKSAELNFHSISSHPNCNLNKHKVNTYAEIITLQKTDVVHIFSLSLNLENRLILMKIFLYSTGTLLRSKLMGLLECLFKMIFFTFINDWMIHIKIKDDGDIETNHVKFNWRY